MGFIDNPDKYFEVDQVPDGFKLIDPSKMKDPQIKEILSFWYSKQEASGFRFKFLQDDKLNGKKRLREDTDSDADSDAKAPSRPRTSQSRSKIKDKGKGKRVGKSDERWTDHIVSDSRRRKQRALAPSEESESGEVFDFASVDQMESSEEEDGPIPRRPMAGPSKRAIPMTRNVTSKGVHRNKGSIGKSTMAPLSKQKNMVMDTATNVAKATDGHRGLEDDQREPVTRDERMVMKTRAAQKVEDRGRKTRFAMDIVTDPRSTGKCCVFYIKLVNKTFNALQI